MKTGRKNSAKQRTGRKMNTMHLALLCLFVLAPFVAFAFDPQPLQNICPADYNTSIFVNGFPCKDPALAVPEDFYMSGLNIPGNISNELGFYANPATVDQIPGLNTMGISVVRLDYAPYGGLDPPHHHARASQIITVLKGKLYVGFISGPPDNSDNRLFAKVLNPGDVYVFPIGLVHFEYNIGKVTATAIASFNSQNPGKITAANTLFGSNPSIDPDVLAKAFHIDQKLVKRLQEHFEPAAACKNK